VIQSFENFIQRFGSSGQDGCLHAIYYGLNTLPEYAPPESKIKERTNVFALFAYIDGQWGIAGIDPHEECAVMFIDQVDRRFGDGTAFVAKLPDKSDAVSTVELQDMQNVLEAVESGALDFDDVFAKLLNNPHNP
jgi:hypothetical protein